MSIQYDFKQINKSFILSSNKNDVIILISFLKEATDGPGWTKPYYIEQLWYVPGRH